MGHLSENVYLHDRNASSVHRVKLFKKPVGVALKRKDACFDPVIFALKCFWFKCIFQPLSQKLI